MSYCRVKVSPNSVQRFSFTFSVPWNSQKHSNTSKTESWGGLWLAGFSAKLGQSIWIDTAQKFSGFFCGRNSVQSAQNVTCSPGVFDNVKGEHFLPKVHVVGWLKTSGGSPSADFKQGKYCQIYQIIYFLLLFPDCRENSPLIPHRVHLVDKVKTSAFLFVICCTHNFSLLLPDFSALSCPY